MIIGDAKASPANFAEIAPDCEAVLLDVYGVLLHAEGLYTHTAPLISWLKNAGKPFMLVSNGSSRTVSESAAAYQRQGIAVTEAEIMTSGMLLSHWVAAEGLNGQSAHVLGRSSSYDIITEAGLVPAPADADVAVVVILNQADQLLTQIDEALTLIIRQLDKGVPMKLVVPNPDCLYPRGAEAFGITAGAIAELLEGALAKRYGPESHIAFTRLGKPFPMIFDRALAKLSENWQRPFAKDKVLMVGDQLATDVKGALEYGLKAMLYQGGVANIHKFEGFALSKDVPNRAFYYAAQLMPPQS